MNQPGHIFVNQSLNLEKISAIGYDMDYTLVHYHPHGWEQRAYDTLLEYIHHHHTDTPPLSFNPKAVIRGLIIDIELGNILKVCQFGQVKTAYHGNNQLSKTDINHIYGKETIHLSKSRYVFLNTLFSLSIGCLFTQLVESNDQHQLNKTYTYHNLYTILQKATEYTHLESTLKNEIMQNPHHYIHLNPITVEALKEQKACGKQLFLVTNSNWQYTDAVMSHAFNPYLENNNWQSLFSLIVCSAQKPRFFSSEQDAFMIDPSTHMLKPCIKLVKDHAIYHGANAHLVEEYLNTSGQDILYVGDHMYTDINISKRVFGWRTCLIIHELDAEIEALTSNKLMIQTLINMRKERNHLTQRLNRLTLDEHLKKSPPSDMQSLNDSIHELTEIIEEYEQQFSQINNIKWGLHMRSGLQKSHLARQIERYADLYATGVQAFHFTSPNCFFDYISKPLPHEGIAW